MPKPWHKVANQQPADKSCLELPRLHCSLIHGFLQLPSKRPHACLLKQHLKVESTSFLDLRKTLLLGGLSQSMDRQAKIRYNSKSKGKGQNSKVTKVR